MKIPKRTPEDFEYKMELLKEAVLLNMELEETNEKIDFILDSLDEVQKQLFIELVINLKVVQGLNIEEIIKKINIKKC